MNNGKIKVSINLIRRKLSLQKRKVYFVFGGKNYNTMHNKKDQV